MRHRRWLWRRPSGRGRRSSVTPTGWCSRACRSPLRQLPRERSTSRGRSTSCSQPRCSVAASPAMRSPRSRSRPAPRSSPQPRLLPIHPPPYRSRRPCPQRRPRRLGCWPAWRCVGRRPANTRTPTAVGRQRAKPSSTIVMSSARKHAVDAFYRSTHERTRSCGARKSSMQLFLRGAVRPAAGEDRRRPTNANPGGTPSG